MYSKKIADCAATVDELQRIEARISQLFPKLPPTVRSLADTNYSEVYSFHIWSAMKQRSQEPLMTHLMKCRDKLLRLGLMTEDEIDIPIYKAIEEGIECPLGGELDQLSATERPSRSQIHRWYELIEQTAIARLRLVK